MFPKSTLKWTLGPIICGSGYCRPLGWELAAQLRAIINVSHSWVTMNVCRLGVENIELIAKDMSQPRTKQEL